MRLLLNHLLVFTMLKVGEVIWRKALKIIKTHLRSMSHHFLRGVEDLQGDLLQITELHKLPANHLPVPVDDGQGGVHPQAPLQQSLGWGPRLSERRTWTNFTVKNISKLLSENNEAHLQVVLDAVLLQLLAESMPRYNSRKAAKSKDDLQTTSIYEHLATSYGI